MGRFVNFSSAELDEISWFSRYAKSWIIEKHVIQNEKGPPVPPARFPHASSLGEAVRSFRFPSLPSLFGRCPSRSPRLPTLVRSFPIEPLELLELLARQLGCELGHPLAKDLKIPLDLLPHIFLSVHRRE